MAKRVINAAAAAMRVALLVFWYQLAADAKLEKILKAVKEMKP